MRTTKFALVIALVVSCTISSAQDKENYKILVTSPEFVIADDEVKKFLQDYEAVSLLIHQEYCQARYLKLAKKKKYPPHIKSHLKYQASFCLQHNVANEITAMLAYSLQLSTNNQNLDYLVIPKEDNHSYSLTALEKLCLSDSADFIFLIHTVTFSIEKQKNKNIIRQEPSFYLYSHEDKKIVYTSESPDPGEDDRIAKKRITINNESYKYFVTGRKNLMNIVTYLNQWQPSPSI